MNFNTPFKKYALALLIGVVLGGYLHKNIATKPILLSMCVDFYGNNFEIMDPDLKNELFKKVHDEDFKTVKELIAARCKYWISNSQKF